jgi:hypothetical protein
MKATQLNRWAKTAWWYMLSEYAVPYVAAEHADATKFAKKWMSSKQESVAACGWATYALTVAVRSDETLDFLEIKELLKTVESKVHGAPNRVRHCMNHFVISVGSYVKPLLSAAKATAKKIGKVEVDVGKTSCKVPIATEYIAKVEAMNRIGKKRTSTKC